MLKICKDKNKNAHIILGDFREEMNLKKEFDLITAFRFFPNAENSLRESAFTFFCKYLNKNGLLIFNNHRSFWSTSYILFRFLGFKTFREGMTHKEINNLLEIFDFEINKVYSLGIIPQSEKRSILPFWLTTFIENINFKFFAQYHLLGYNNIYVCSKKKYIREI